MLLYDDFDVLDQVWWEQDGVLSVLVDQNDVDGLVQEFSYCNMVGEFLKLQKGLIFLYLFNYVMYYCGQCYYMLIQLGVDVFILDMFFYLFDL